MFSDVRNYPRYQIQLDSTDPVPKFIPRQWRGYSQQARDAINRYKKYDLIFFNFAHVLIHYPKCTKCILIKQKLIKTPCLLYRQVT